MTTAKKYYTWTEIWAKLKTENDIDDEDDFIDEDEARGFCNDAIDNVEADIHTLYEDYYLTPTAFSFVDGVDTIDLPASIYAHKVRKLWYTNGTTSYEITRIRDWKKFHVHAAARQTTGNRSEYRYFIINTTPGSPKFLISPVPYESGAYGTAWHLRNLNRLEAGADICDVIEIGMQYVWAYLAERVEFKRAAGSPRHIAALAVLEKTEAKIASTLAQMVPDDNNEIEPDFSHYEEHN